MLNKALVGLSALVLACSVAQARMPLPLLEQAPSGSTTASTQQLIEVVVVSVLDGDTIRVDALSTDVRLASIDAPETAKHSRGKVGQPFSQAATAHLNHLIGKPPRNAQLKCYERDSYKRFVCDLFVRDVNIGHQMVADGYSWANTASGGRFLRAPHLLELQRQARLKRIGLWSDNSQPIEPWVWRKKCWSIGICQSAHEDHQTDKTTR